MGFCSPSIWDEEAGGSQWGQRGWRSKTLDILPCLLFPFSSLSLQHFSSRIVAALSCVCLKSCAIGQIPKIVSFADVEIWLFLNGIFGGHMVILGPYFKISDFLTVGADFSVIHFDSPCELFPSVLGYREALHCSWRLQWDLYVIW